MSKVRIRYLVSVIFLVTVLFTSSSVIAAPPDNFTFDILNGKLQQISADLYVSLNSMFFRGFRRGLSDEPICPWEEFRRRLKNLL